MLVFLEGNASPPQHTHEKKRYREQTKASEEQKTGSTENPRPPLRPLRRVNAEIEL